MSFKTILRWLPALLIMGVIFSFSATSSDDLPGYGDWDTLVKKGGHMLGYGLLALACWFGLNGRSVALLRPYLLAWVLAVLYALTDEFHQQFTPGRNSSPFDVLVYDAGGAALALLFVYGFRMWKLKQKRAV